MKVGDKVTLSGTILQIDTDALPIQVLFDGPDGETLWLPKEDIIVVEPTTAEPDLTADDMEILGIGTSVQAAHRRSMALHHAVDYAKAVASKNYHFDTVDIVATAEAFTAFLEG